MSFSKIRFSLTIHKWNELDPNIRNSENINLFKNKILKFIRPKPNSVFDCHNPIGTKIITWLRLGLDHLFEQVLLNLICNGGYDNEETTHYLLPSPVYTNERMTLLDKISNINTSVLEQNDTNVT